MTTTTAASVSETRVTNPSAELAELSELTNRVMARVFEEFEYASTAERKQIAEAFSQHALDQQAHLAGFSRVLDTASSSLSTVSKDLGYASLSVLFQQKIGFGRTQADLLVRLGKLLRSREYPVLADAVEDGSISHQQAGVIVRKLDSWADTCEPEFLAYADKSSVIRAEGYGEVEPWTPESLEASLRSWHQEQYPEEAVATAEQLWQQRSCTIGVNHDGMANIRVLIPAEAAATVASFIEANASPRNVQFRDSDDPHDDDFDNRTMTQKRADAFLRAFTVAAKTTDTSTQSGAAPTLTVTVPMSEVDKYANEDAALARLDRTGERIPLRDATKIICEGAIQVAMTDNHGNVLNLGRTQRLFTPKQRRAINHTYRTCAVGSCSIPAAWCESHHATWWSRGGATDLDNAVNLCSFHHHEVHRGKIDLRRCPDTNRWQAIRPTRT